MPKNTMINFLMKYMLSAQRDDNGYTWVITARNLITTVILICTLVASVTAGILQTLAMPSKIKNIEKELEIFKKVDTESDMRLKLIEANINTLNTNVQNIARNTEQIQTILMQQGQGRIINKERYVR